MMASLTSVPPNSPPPVNNFRQVAGESRRRQSERDPSDILPPELWFEILVRLHVRYLLPLKCVSKKLQSLIENPDFTALHYSRFYGVNPQSNASNLLLLGREFSSSSTKPCWDYFLVRRSCTPTQQKTTQFKFHVLSGQYCEVLGNVNGLLLLQNYTSSSTYMILWNPLIGKRMIVPPPPSSCSGMTKLGFGYDPGNNDYKIVSILALKGYSLVEIYSVRELSWRTTGVKIYGWVLESCVYVNGVLHWLAHRHLPFYANRMSHYEISHVFSFDLGSEVLSYTELPHSNINNDVKLLVLFNGSLALLCVRPLSISAWVMKGSKWTKEWDVNSMSEFYQHLLDEECDTCSAVFSEKHNEILAAGCKGMVSYNIKTQQFKFQDCRMRYVGTYEDRMIWKELSTKLGSAMTSPPVHGAL